MSETEETQQTHTAQGRDCHSEKRHKSVMESVAIKGEKWVVSMEKMGNFVWYNYEQLTAAIWFG